MTGYIVPAGPHRKLLCSECNSYVKFVPKDKPQVQGYTTLATLHRITKGNRTYYVGRAEDYCQDCGVVHKHEIYIFKQDDGSLTLNRKDT